MKYTSIIFIFLLSATSYSAEFIPKKLSQMTDDLGVGTHTADTSDPHGASMTQTNLTVGSLTVTGNLNATISGYIAQNGGTGTGNILTNTNLISPTISYVQNDNGYFTNIMIASGTGTLSQATIAGIAAPYIKQTNGTGTGLTLSGTNIINGVTAPYISQSNGTGTLSAATIAGVAAPYIAQNGGTGTVSSLQSTGNLSITKDGQNKITFKRTTIGSDALSLAMLSIYGSDTTGAETNFANIEASIGSATDNQESGKIALWTMRDGFIDERLSIVGTSAAFGGTGNKVDVEVYGTITARDGIKFTSDNSTLNSGNIVKGIVAGSGISIDQSTGTVTINASGATGGWTDGTNTVYTTVAADKVVIGSTTASGSNILTVVGSTTVNDLSISNALGLGFTGTPLINMAIGDSDTGFKWLQDGDFAIYGNNEEQIKIDGNNDRILIGTTTSGTKLNVGGTVTASGFSGNGAGLTNLPSSPVAFSEVAGSATASQLPLTHQGTTTATAGYTVLGDANGSITAWMPPVNIVFASKTDTQTLGSGWNNITGLAGTITLRSVNSRVKIDVSVVGWANDNSAIRILRNGSAIGVGDTASNRSQVFKGTYSNAEANSSCITNSGFWVDTPGTTSASYVIQGLTTSGSFYINRSSQDPDTTGGLRAVSTLTLTEIY